MRTSSHALERETWSAQYSRTFQDQDVPPANCTWRRRDVVVNLPIGYQLPVVVDGNSTRGMVQYA